MGEESWDGMRWKEIRIDWNRRVDMRTEKMLEEERRRDPPKIEENTREVKTGVKWRIEDVLWIKKARQDKERRRTKIIKKAYAVRIVKKIFHYYPYHIEGAKACTNFSYDRPSWTNSLNSSMRAAENSAERAPNKKNFSLDRITENLWVSKYD